MLHNQTGITMTRLGAFLNAGLNERLRNMVCLFGWLVGWLVVYFTTSFEYGDTWMMMNRKGFGRKRSWPSLMCYASIRLEGLRKTTKNLISIVQSLGPRFEPGTSRIWSMRVNHDVRYWGTWGSLGWCLDGTGVALGKLIQNVSWGHLWGLDASEDNTNTNFG
jgi:hypothetical protein